MSLEEFLGDDSLGDSVWNEDDINLDAISNTTNIDILKSKTQKQQGSGNNEHPSRPFGYRSPPLHHSNLVDGDGTNSTSSDNNANVKPYVIPTGPPYIVKFSQLPPNFAAVDIDDLFHEKFTKYKKCKMFWELNPNPSIATLNTGTVFEQNFKREGKVSFVEVITGRDMDKILKYWTQPLLKYYNIKVEPAQFADFNEYNAKVKLLTDPRDDATKPYIPPKSRQSSKSSKSNPFGSARPVDTQSKILDIEEKVGKLHVEDTSTLRRISDSDPSNPEQHQQRVTILKKPHEEESASSSSAIEEPPAKPLSYLQVIKKTAEESKKSSSSSSLTTRLSSPVTNPVATASSATAPAATIPSSTNDGTTQEASSSSPPPSLLEKSFTASSVLEDRDGGTNDHNQRHQNSNNYHHNNGYHQQNHHQGSEDRPYYKRTSYSDGNTSFRGRRGSRGGSFRRGNGPRGGARGGGFRYQNENRRGGISNHNNSFNGSFNNHHNQQDGKNHSQEEKHYSIFKPASGFLWEGGNDKPMNGPSQRGGHFGRGSYRGGRNRRNNGFTTV